MQGVAPILRAALASLEADWAQQIALYNAEAANRIDLDQPAASIQPGFQTGGGFVFGAAPVMDSYPTVEVNALEGTFGPFSTGDPAESGDFDSTPRLNVVVWLQGVTGEVPDLYESALGYVRVVTEILCQKDALGVSAEVSGTRDDAVAWNVDVIPSGPADVEREFRIWKLPIQLSFAIEAVEEWV